MSLDQKVDSHIQWNHVFGYIDSEWITHKLPKEVIPIPREHVPDPDADALPATLANKENAIEAAQKTSFSLNFSNRHIHCATMGNEQSASGPSNSTQPSTSTFSFLSNRASVKKVGGIVKVSDGQSKLIDPNDDPDYKRLMDIPRFLPILRDTVPAGRRLVMDNQNLFSYRPLWRLSVRLQSHLHGQAQGIAQEQGRITQLIKTVDVTSAGIAAKLLERRKKYDRLRGALAHVTQLRDEVVRIQLLLEEIVPTDDDLASHIFHQMPVEETQVVDA
ncbi:unnamed protein product, partial [Mesorhabditis belari]|uniref:BLOC-1-related complex subunit 5 n=1 Tax=Mesorhabditis belari TaxID=2138241 RepID=A0AAF3ES93_9BILA